MTPPPSGPAFETIGLFVATKAEDAPFRHYVSVDGHVPGSAAVWDHHVSGEPVNLDALPAVVDLDAIAREASRPGIEAIGTTSADADAVVSAAVVLLGGVSQLPPAAVAVLRSASCWCDHLRAGPGDTPEIAEAGRGLAEWIARSLLPSPTHAFERVTRELASTLVRGAPLPSLPPDPARLEILARIRAEGRLDDRGPVAVVDLRGLPSIAPLEVHGLHQRPVTVFLHEHAAGGRRYVVGVNPHAPGVDDLRPALLALAEAEFERGPPVLGIAPGNETENWGGRAAAFGSPWNHGSRLAPDEVGTIVARALRLDSERPGA